MTENVPRILPDNLDARIWLGSWPVRNIFTLIQSAGDIDLFEMLRTFNMGVGLVMVIPPSEIRDAIRLAEQKLYRASRIGEIREGTGTVRFD